MSGNLIYKGQLNVNLRIVHHSELH